MSWGLSPKGRSCGRVQSERRPNGGLDAAYSISEPPKLEDLRIGRTPNRQRYPCRMPPGLGAPLTLAAATDGMGRLRA